MLREFGRPPTYLEDLSPVWSSVLKGWMSPELNRGAYERTIALWRYLKSDQKGGSRMYSRQIISY